MSITPGTTRIISWNCGGGFHRKAHRITELEPDIAVLQEVMEKDALAMGPEYKVDWTGRTNKKGLLIATRRGWNLQIQAKTQANHLVQFAASQDTKLIIGTGVWSVPPGARNYTKTVCDGLDELTRLSCPPEAMRIILGDFNASPVFDKSDTRANQFSRILDRMDTLSLDSLWHSKTGEDIGDESQPTLYMQYNANKPYHIDYIFGCDKAGKALEEMRIGRYDEWCKGWSDHMPIIADFRY